MICIRGCGTIYKAVFVFITVLAGICVSLLKEAGGGLMLSLASSHLGPWEYGHKKGYK